MKRSVLVCCHAVVDDPANQDAKDEANDVVISDEPERKPDDARVVDTELCP